MRTIKKEIVSVKVQPQNTIREIKNLVSFYDGDNLSFSVELNPQEKQNEDLTLVVLTNAINDSRADYLSQGEWDLYLETEWIEKTIEVNVTPKEYDGEDDITT
jgi:hypothetical protein